MKKTEKIISAFLLMALGITFILLKDNFIGILMTVVGGSLIVFGVVDIVNRAFPFAVIKTVSGILLIVCGWAIVEAVLYILSGVLLIFGILLLYDKIKNQPRCSTVWQGILFYATPTVCIIIGTLLLFHRSTMVDFIFIVSGILIVAEGGVLLFNAFSEE